jgi:tRNA A-37 threonylcarbamoyl transferase component Bud32
MLINENTESWISHIYKWLLLRVPHEIEIEQHLELSPTDGPNEFLERIFSSDEFRSNRAFFEERYFQTNGSNGWLGKVRQSKLAVTRLFEGDGPPKPPESGVDLAGRIARVVAAQGHYQPFFGMDIQNEIGRRAILDRNVSLVSDVLASYGSPAHTRILDVGSNCGYVTMRLATIYPHVIGIEGDYDCYALASALALQSNSSACFKNADFLDYAMHPDGDLSSADAVLLFNVVHQIIFIYGLKFAKMFMKRVCSQVDYVFAELAVREDYKDHPKASLLPTDPGELFEYCHNVEIQLIPSGVRPMYIIKKTRYIVGQTILNYPKVSLGNNPDRTISRKFLSTTDQFAKIYRLGNGQKEAFFYNEVSALHKIYSLDIGPKILDWCIDDSSACVVMEKIYGEKLFDIISRPNSLSGRRAIVRGIMGVVSALTENGLYQNDMSPHNFIVDSHGVWRLLDFELATDSATNDPYAMILWIINDLYKARHESYDLGVHLNLRVIPGTNRCDPAHYPSFGSILQDDTVVSEIVERLKSEDPALCAFRDCVHILHQSVLA